MDVQLLFAEWAEDLGVAWPKPSALLVSTARGRAVGALRMAHIVTSSFDGTAQVWRMTDGTHVRTLKGHTSAVCSVCVSPDGMHVVTASADRTALVWRLDEGAILHTLRGHTGAVMSVCVSPDGAHVVTGSIDKSAQVWLMADGARVRQIRGHTRAVVSVSVSPDGAHVLTASLDKTVRIWRMADGVNLLAFTGSVACVSHLSPDGMQMHVVTAADQTARVLRIAGGKAICVRALVGPPASVCSVCMSPDGKHVVTASADHKARVWRMADGVNLHTLTGHHDALDRGDR